MNTPNPAPVRPCTCDAERPIHVGRIVDGRNPCGRRVIPGVTRCPDCGHLEDSPECDKTCGWEPFTEADLDALYLEAWLGGTANEVPHD